MGDANEVTDSVILTSNDVKTPASNGINGKLIVFLVEHFAEHFIVQVVGLVDV